MWISLSWCQMSKIDWKITETVGMGIVNPRALKPRLKGAKAFYVQVLKFQREVVEQYELYLNLEKMRGAWSKEEDANVRARLEGVHISSEA